jgi:hypothetical protein
VAVRFDAVFLSQCRCQRLHAIDPPGGEQEVRALFREIAGAGFADPRRGPGNENTFVSESVHAAACGLRKSRCGD